MTALDDMKRSLRALYLEVDASIADDLQDKFNATMAEVIVAMSNDRENAIEKALRAAAMKWKAFTRCPTCEGRSRETRNKVCQTCGHDYASDGGSD